MNEVKIREFRGVKGLVCAEVTEDTAQNYTTDTVKKIAGVAELSKTTDSSSDVHYYDDIPALTIEGTGPDEVNVNVSAIPLDILAMITGQYYDEATGTLVEGEREEKYFALGYITEKTDGSEVYVWRHKGTFSIPDEKTKTKDNSSDAQGQELKYTGISTNHIFTKSGKPAKAINCDASRINTANFFETAQTIDSISAKTTQTDNTPA